jgi:rhodanese-related sulfurtransferase
MAADELNNQGFDSTVTIEGGYSIWKGEKKKNDNCANNK